MVTADPLGWRCRGDTRSEDIAAPGEIPSLHHSRTGDKAIKTMAIRGAPAVGVAGALALVLGARSIGPAIREFRRKILQDLP